MVSTIIKPPTDPTRPPLGDEKKPCRPVSFAHVSGVQALGLGAKVLRGIGRKAFSVCLVASYQLELRRKAVRNKQKFSIFLKIVWLNCGHLAECLFHGRMKCVFQAMTCAIKTAGPCRIVT